MSDTLADFVTPAREDVLGASEKNFCEWLILHEKSKIPKHYLRAFFELDDRGIVGMLREQYWDEYMGDLEEMHDAQHTDKLMEASR